MIKISITKAEREGFEPPIPKRYTAFRVQRIQPGSAISPILVQNYKGKLKCHLQKYKDQNLKNI